MPPYQRRIILALIAIILIGISLKLVDRQRQAVQFDIKGFLDGYKHTIEVDTSRPNIEASTNALIQPKEIEPGDSTAIEPVSVVNINTADISQIQKLPGIGPVLAQRIVDYRDSIGHYEKPEDLLGVAGIGEKKLLKMEPFLTF